VGRSSRDGLVVARTTFFRGQFLVRAGEVWAADDPVVTGYPSAFSPIVVNSTKVAEEKPEPAPRVAGRFTARQSQD
jgi:hypothetical protein